MSTGMLRDQKDLFRIGGLSAIALGIGYVVIVGLYVPMGAPPKGPEARLAYLAANMTAWWAVLALSVVTDLLFIPVALSLYDALQKVNRNAMVLATAFVTLFIVLDLAITWTNYAALLALSSRYVAAATAAEKASAIAAAAYPTAMLESSLLFVYNSLTLAVGILITSLVMLRSDFSRTVAYLGVFAGGSGLIAVLGSFFGSALSIVIVVTSVLMTVWLFIVGRALLTIARR